MARIVSFVVLVAILVVIAGLFFKVMANFLLPMFLAVLLVIIFKPLHLWFVETCRGRDRLAAGLTTASIILIFLVPLALILWQAGIEAAKIHDALFPIAAEADGPVQKAGPPETAPEAEASGFQPAYLLLPMFLAVLLMLVYRPLYGWFLIRCKGRARPATGLTVASIVLTCLIPLAVVALRSDVDDLPKQPVSNEDLGLKDRAIGQLVQLGNKFGLQLTVKDIEPKIMTKVQDWLTPLAFTTTQYVAGLLVGLGIMVISLYYFLADGPGMVRTIMRLSPLDNRYEEQLIDQFQDLTRAVVLATLISAFVQGILAGIGFFFAALSSVFLLTVLAMLFAIIPFVGSTLVWVPACLWLHFYQGRTAAAILLAVYCGVVVSMADNVIKPIVLHGRSNLHPLLALLSVLGGVQALGPIGIFVGPMVVVFLQTLLNMLHTELDSMADGLKTERQKAGAGG